MSPRIRVSLCVAGVLLISPAGLRGDVIRLKNGGEVRGLVERSNLGVNQPRVVIQTLSGGRVVVGRDDVEFVSPRSLKVEEYETRARSLPDTVEAHGELAEWCRKNLLKDQRTEQLEAILDLDSGHPETHKALGHVLQNGSWLTRDEWMASRGYIKYKGRFVTQQELDLLEKSAAEREAEREWFPKVRLWFGWASGSNVERQSDGINRLRSIDDSNAVPALTNVMGKHRDDDVRLLYVERLGAMQGPKPVRLLVERSLLDEDQEVRGTARGGIKPDQFELALDYYVPELKHDSNSVVNRAAAAIERMGDINVAPYLIEALVTEHKWKAQVPVHSASTVGMSSDGQVGMLAPSTISGAGMLPADVEVALRTGQLPYGAIVVPPPGMRPRTRTVTYKADLKNEQVLSALQKITGQDFGYNKRDWQVWWATRSRASSQL